MYEYIYNSNDRLQPYFTIECSFQFWLLLLDLCRLLAVKNKSLFRASSYFWLHGYGKKFHFFVDNP